MWFSPADLGLFAFSLIGLMLVPTALGRAAWIFPAGFAALGLFLLHAPDALHPGRNAWIWLLLSQGPWLLLAADLAARGRAARALDAVPLRALLAWSLVQGMAGRHVFSALSGDLEPGFALEVATGGLLTAFGALLLRMFHRPGRGWFLFAALFWNVHALIASLALSTRLLRAHPGMRIGGQPSPEIHGYFAAWPGALEALFWIPLAIGLEAALFYKLLRSRPEISPPGFLPGSHP